MVIRNRPRFVKVTSTWRFTEKEKVSESVFHFTPKTLVSQSVVKFVSVPVIYQSSSLIIG